MTAPSVLVFDVNETLLDIRTLEPLFTRLFGAPGVMREWFAQMVLYSEALTLSGGYAPFAAIGAGVLRMLGTVHGVAVVDGDVDELRRRMGAMPAHDDAADALRRLREAGFRLVSLTNSAPNPAGSGLDRAGLGGWFERQFSVDSVRRFKPAPETYRLVSDGLGVAPGALCMVAAHAWDTLGAQRAGWAGALVTRAGNAVLPVAGVPEPDVVGAGLGEVADALLRRWR